MMLTQVYYQTQQQLKLRKSFTPTLSSSTKYDIYFRNALFNPHSGHNSASYILSSTGFKVSVVI